MENYRPLEHLDDVLYVGRPAFGQENSTISLFKLDSDGKGAVRVPVKVGRAFREVRYRFLKDCMPATRSFLSDMSRSSEHRPYRLD